MDLEKKIYFVTGSGFSGSGFLMDWLQEQITVAVHPTRIFSYRNKQESAKIGFEICKIADCKNTDEVNNILDDIINKLVQITRDNNPPPSPRGFLHEINRRYGRSEILKLLQFIKRLLIKRYNPERKIPKLDRLAAINDLRLFQSMKERLVKMGGDSVRIEEFRYLLPTINEKMIFIDKSFPKEFEYAQSLLRVFDEIGVIFVIRNPSDQIYDKFRNKKSSKNSQRDFKNNLSLIADKLERDAEFMIELKRKFPDRIHIVQFEKLVNDHEGTLERLMKSLNISNKVFFGPYDHLSIRSSGLNIGISNDIPWLRALGPSSGLYNSYLRLVKLSI